MVDKELPCLVPESKPKIPPMTGVYQHMQIGVLEIQQHHPPTFAKTLQNRGEGFHTELGNSYKQVEFEQVEDGAEPTSALGSQEIMGIKSPLVP